MTTAPVWKVKFYGVRGSIPICHPEFTEFGGNTTCFLLDLLKTPIDEKVTVIFDAGTGIRQLGKDIVDGRIPKAEHILIQFSHFHWDHIQGFPFFAPAYFEGQSIVLFSPHYLEESATKLKEIFDLQMQSEYFPVQLNKIGADVRFHTHEKEFQRPLNMDPLTTFTYVKHQHPGDAFSYRLDGYGKSVVFCTDIEHGAQIDEEVVEFCRDADLLIHDAQYTDEELLEHRGWGHSSFSQAIEVAERANVQQLYLTHHDPDHNDAFLRRIEKECQQRFPNCHLAREGEEVFI
jgi:phosphoribosyl 1,2-cyclic phosphodiesterase